MATMLVNIAKILISVFRLIVFLENKNQIPITANIRKTDKNENKSAHFTFKTSTMKSASFPKPDYCNPAGPQIGGVLHEGGREGGEGWHGRSFDIF